MEINRIKYIGKKALPYITAFFFIFVLYILSGIVSKIDWQEVKVALEKLSWNFLFFSVIIVFLNYFIFASYDYIGFRFLQAKSLKFFKVIPSAFICYAFNFNLGSLIGGLGFRYRIYSGWKVPKRKIPRLIFFSTMTNWLGYTLLISLIFCFKASWINEWISIPNPLIIFIGMIVMGLLITYVVFCHKHYKFNFKKTTFRFPHDSTAFLQFILSTAQWCLASSVIYLILKNLGSDLPYGEVLFTYLVAAVAGVITHIPAGLGVLEAIFLKMQVDNVPAADLVVALLCFRAIYYLLPLIFAIPGYAFLEIYQKKNSTH